MFNIGQCTWRWKIFLGRVFFRRYRGFHGRETLKYSPGLVTSSLLPWPRLEGEHSPGSFKKKLTKIFFCFSFICCTGTRSERKRLGRRSYLCDRKRNFWRFWENRKCRGCTRWFFQKLAAFWISNSGKFDANKHTFLTQESQDKRLQWEFTEGIVKSRKNLGHAAWKQAWNDSWN